MRLLVRERRADESLGGIDERAIVNRTEPTVGGGVKYRKFWGGKKELGGSWSSMYKGQTISGYGKIPKAWNPFKFVIDIVKKPFEWVADGVSTVAGWIGDCAKS